MSGRHDATRLRERLRPISLDRWYRIIDARFESTPLGAVPAPGRFGDPALAFAVLYAAEDDDGIIESEDGSPAELIIRIISARKANPDERTYYEGPLP